jgi:hypothetical protein
MLAPDVHNPLGVRFKIRWSKHPHSHVTSTWCNRPTLDRYPESWIQLEHEGQAKSLLIVNPCPNLFQETSHTDSVNCCQTDAPDNCSSEAGFLGFNCQTCNYPVHINILEYFYFT